MDIILNLWIFVSVIWLAFSGYRRFIKKNPIKHEQGIIKLWNINAEAGRTRLFSDGDAMTIVMFYLPLYFKFPEYGRALTLFFIPSILFCYMHSFIILLNKQKSKATPWVARFSLLFIISCIILSVREVIHVL